MFQTINPATGEVVQTYEHMNSNEVDAVLNVASRSFQAWKVTPLSERQQALKRLAARLRGSKNELALLMNQEMGKALDEGQGEIEKCAETCEYFADRGPEFLKSQVVATRYAQSEIQLLPLGIIFSIMPWNFPFWQFIRFAAPSLMIGNVISLKHSDLTAGCASKIEELCRPLFKDPLVLNLRIDHEEAARAIRHPLIRGVTFTGSTRGGREVGRVAGEALKKTVLELGGNDAYLVFPDADVAKAAQISAQARMINHGQSCIAGKRFIVHKDVFESFIQRFHSELSTYKTKPLASLKFRTQLQEQVEKMKQWGGRVLLGGEVPTGVGAFYPPTLIVFEKNHPEAHLEELFGPVALVFKVECIEDAFEMANSSPYGLGGGIFSRDAEEAQALGAQKLESGFVAINDFVRSDARLPFGGVKDSGHGRELSVFGFHEFCNIKTLARGVSS